LCYDAVSLTRLEMGQVLAQLCKSPLGLELFWTVSVNCHALWRDYSHSLKRLLSLAGCQITSDGLEGRCRLWR
jgi:hypothetical protein